MAGITADIWQRTRSVRRQMKQQLVPQPQLVAHLVASPAGRTSNPQTVRLRFTAFI